MPCYRRRYNLSLFEVSKTFCLELRIPNLGTLSTSVDKKGKRWSHLGLIYTGDCDLELAYHSQPRALRTISFNYDIDVVWRA